MIYECIMCEIAITQLLYLNLEIQEFAKDIREASTFLLKRIVKNLDFCSL